jgi:hypothetical protein
MVLLVMGRELVSFKIVESALSIDVAGAAGLESPDIPRALTIALVVEDMSLRDMQASSCPLQSVDVFLRLCAQELLLCADRGFPQASCDHCSVSARSFLLRRCLPLGMCIWPTEYRDKGEGRILALGDTNSRL